MSTVTKVSPRVGSMFLSAAQLDARIKSMYVSKYSTHRVAAMRAVNPSGQATLSRIMLYPLGVGQVAQEVTGSNDFFTLLNGSVSLIVASRLHPHAEKALAVRRAELAAAAATKAAATKAQLALKPVELLTGYEIYQLAAIVHKHQQVKALVTVTVTAAV
jgi:hypothetical protein